MTPAKLPALCLLLAMLDCCAPKMLVGEDHGRRVPESAIDEVRTGPGAR